MKDDKICFSKTLTYLVLLVAVVFGAFWMMNYTNSTKIGGTPKAANSCNATVANYDNGCERLQPRQDTRNSGSRSTPTKEYSGRRCVVAVSGSATTYEWQNDTLTCPKTIRCIYGGVTHIRAGADVNSNFDDTDNNMCAQNTDGTLIGVKCTLTSGNTYISKSTAACAASTARTQCQVDGVQVYANGTANQSYTFGTGAQARCIYYKGGLTGFKCDASTFKNTRDAACTTSTGRTQCQVNGEQIYANGIANKTYTFGTGAQATCILENGRLTGLKCDGATFRNTKDANCAATVAACSGTCSWYSGSLTKGTCGTDANGAFWKCDCKSGSSFASLTGPYDSCP